MAHYEDLIKRERYEVGCAIMRGTQTAVVFVKNTKITRYKQKNLHIV